MKRILTTLSPPLLLLLAGCSPHPGTGMWVAAESTGAEHSSAFARINVTYEGRANIYDWKSDPAGDSDATAIRRCFWSGVDEMTITLNCVQAINTEREETYLLRVEPQGKGAVLLQDGRTVIRLLRNVSAR
jgi:hypothetical protein